MKFRQVGSYGLVEDAGVVAEESSMANGAGVDVRFLSC